MIKNIIYILLLSILVSSCEDELKIEPENSVTFENYFKSEQDFQATLTKVHLMYNELKSTGSRPAFYGQLADKKFSWLTQEISREPDSFKYSGNWQAYYGLMTWASMLEEYVWDSNLTKDRKEFYAGQGKFFKALMYLRIVQMWRDAPFVDGVEDAGVKAKIGGNELLKHAASICEEAIKILKPFKELKTASGGSWNTKQIAGKEAAYTLLAHIYAWKAQVFNDDTAFQKSIDAASEVFKSSDYYLAANPEEVVTQVIPGNHPEVLFEVYLNYNEMDSKYGFWNFAKDYQGWPSNPLAKKGEYVSRKQMGIKNETVEKMYAAEDLRRNAYFYKFDELKDDPILEGWAVVNIMRTPVYEIWDGQESFANFDGDLVIWRLGGLYLLRAEMYAAIGELGLAEADLNKIRTRANAPLYDKTEGPLKRIIFEEREKELFTQGHRWYDCIRNGYWKTDIEELEHISDEDYENGALYMPVHMFAFTNNPLMKQNKYWLGRW